MKENKSKTTLSYVYAAAGVILLTLFDQYTKAMAVLHLKDQSAFVIWKGVFQLNYLENRGAAFGIMQNQQMFFAIVAAIILIILIILYNKMPHTKKFWLLRFCSVLLCAGAIGNMIDRIKLNYVIDFFDFNLINFPIFNVADCYVVVACILFAISILFYYTDDELKCFSLKKGKK